MLARERRLGLVADASHELRTPLTSVLANLELLELELKGESREAAASALRSSRRMRRLVADLLLLARADAGHITGHVPLDLSEVVTEAAGELEPVAGDHQISVSAPPGAEMDGTREITSGACRPAGRAVLLSPGMPRNATKVLAGLPSSYEAEPSTSLGAKILFDCFAKASPSNR